MALRQQLPFRLSPENTKRLDKTAHYCGQSRQTFMENAVLAQIEDIEGQRQSKKIDLQIKRDHHNEPSPPIGGGLLEALQKRQENASAETEAEAEPKQGHVVVNVGNNSGSNGDFIDRLATYVVAGRDFERTTRLREAVRMIQETTVGEEERKVLAAKLDETIASKNKNKTEGKSFARVTFDKLADLLR